jgi:hypothetical protein
MGPKQADKGGSRRTWGEDHSKIKKREHAKSFSFLFFLKR